MNTMKLDNSNNSKRKKSYFWNTIDNTNLSEKGRRQDKDNRAVKENVFSKFFKKLNSAIFKSPFAGQRSGNKVDIKHTQYMGEIQIPKLQKDSLISISGSHTLGNGSTDWTNSVLCQLDEIKKIDNTDCNELIANSLQPSGMDSNRHASHNYLAAMDEKLGVISKKTMINDWLHYNSIPKPATTTMPTPSYLQYYHNNNNNNCNFYSKKEFTDRRDESSLISAQLKKQGKKKHDHIKEKLDIAAARRNAIKTNRLKEQMDAALYETMHLLRNYNENMQQGKQTLQQQDLEDLFLSNIKKGGRKVYYSDDTASSSLSTEYCLPIKQFQQQALY